MEELKIRVGSKVKIATAWGMGKVVEGIVTGFGMHHEKSVFDYNSKDPEAGGWAYMYQLEEVIEY